MEKYIFTTLFLLIFISYISFVWIKFGVLPSISKSFDELEHERKFVFTIFCWSIAILYFLACPNIVSFIAGAGIITVGTNPFLDKKMHFIIHMIGATVGITFSQLGIIFYYDFYWIFIPLAIELLYCVLWPKNLFWWIEIFALLNVVIRNYFDKN